MYSKLIHIYDVHIFFKHKQVFRKRPHSPKFVKKNYCQLTCYMEKYARRDGKTERKGDCTPSRQIGRKRKADRQAAREPGRQTDRQTAR